MEQLKKESVKLVTILVTFLTVLHTGLTSTTPSFLAKDGCICPGADVRNLTYECTTIGPGNTHWRGTAFNCPGKGNEISLLHSQFGAGGSSAECNNGNITGRSLRVEGNCYTSQLFVVYSQDLLGQSVVCAHNNLVTEEVVGNATIAITTEPFPPPNSITLFEILRGPQLTFNWTRPTSNCPSVEYLITHVNCGNCPTTTAANTAACMAVPVDGSVCRFSVKTRICGNIEGESNSLDVILKAPDAPKVNQPVPTYSYETGELAAIKTEFEESTSFNITANNDGSAVSYTVTYTNALTDDVCATHTVLSSSCQEGVCTHLFDVSTSDCPRSVPISVVVSGTNVLGTGPPSTPVSIFDVTNDFVNVTTTLLSSAVVCAFQSQEEGDNVENTCSVTYYQPEGDGCTVEEAETMLKSSLMRQSAHNTSNTVVVGIPFVQRLLDNRVTYCFVVSATNGTRTARVHGVFNRGCDPNLLYEGRTQTVPNEALCDSPLTSISVEEGYACYIGTFVGASAVHHCLGCDDRVERVCLADGTWDGTIPQCDCSDSQSATADGSMLQLYLGILLSIIAILVTLFTIFTIAYILLILKKRRTNVQVDLLRARVTELSTVYEELDTDHGAPVSESSDNLETINNRAYKTIEKSMKSELDIPAYDVPKSELQLDVPAYDVCRPD